MALEPTLAQGVTQNPPSPAPSPQSPNPQSNQTLGGNDKTPAPKTSIYEELNLEDPDKTGKVALWPDNWRDQFQGAGKADGKDFANLDSPVAVAKSYLALKQRISSGEFKRATPIPEGAAATPEAVNQWRADNNIPVEADKYVILPSTVKADTLDEASEGYINDWQKIFHGANVTQEVAAKISQGAFELASKQMESVAQGDAASMDKTEDSLRANWGADYKANIKINIAHVNKVFGPDVGAQFFEARLPNGMKIGNIPGVSQAINQWARSEGGDSLVGTDTSGGWSVDGRITEIEALMAKNMNDYTPALADEYLKLLSRREARKG